MLKYLPILILFLPHVISAGSLPSINQYITSVERYYKLPKGILKAIIKVESGGNITAINPNDGNRLQRLRGKIVKSIGLMQLQLATARHVKFKGSARELLHPMINIEYGARYLKLLLTTHKNNIAQALTCYNSGISSRACSNRQYTPYVGKVLNALYTR